MFPTLVLQMSEVEAVGPSERVYTSATPDNVPAKVFIENLGDADVHVRLNNAPGIDVSAHKARVVGAHQIDINNPTAGPTIVKITFL